MLTNMNPQSPNNQGGVQMQPDGPQTMDPSQPMPVNKNTRTIRDYIALARSRNQAPSFTNIPGGQGFDVRQDPRYIPDQAIPADPVDDYESVPWDQRVKQDPYMRALRSSKRMLPELFQLTFPDKQMGGEPLTPEEMKTWEGVVGKLTGNLVDRYDKQYEWYMKNKDKGIDKREKDEQFWQKFYAQQEAQMKPPVNEDGTIMSPQEFINKQMAISDQRRMQSDLENVEAKGTTGQKTIDDISDEEKVELIRKNPKVQKALAAVVKNKLSDLLGKELTDQEFYALRSDPEMAQQFQKATQEAVSEMQDDLVNIANGGEYQPKDMVENRPEAMSVPQ